MRLFSGSNGVFKWALALYVTPILSRVNSPLFMKSAFTWWKDRKREMGWEWRRETRKKRREGEATMGGKWDDQLIRTPCKKKKKIVLRLVQHSRTDNFTVFASDRRERARFIHSWVNVSSLVTQRANFLWLTPCSSPTELSLSFLHTHTDNWHHHLVFMISMYKAFVGTVLWLYPTNQQQPCSGTKLPFMPETLLRIFRGPHNQEVTPKARKLFCHLHQVSN